MSINALVGRARAVMEGRGSPPANYLAPDIYDSWMRCISLGLDTRNPPPPEIVSQAALRQEQQRWSLVRGLALAEMHTLHQQIAGTNFMIAFASPEGLLLDVVSDRSFDDLSGAASIRPGSIWSEAYCGTNGLGTAAHLRRPIVVHGEEHFFSRYNNLTCAASPIFAPDGTLTGILDASSNCLSRQAHTQALVAMAATQIENGLFREQHRGSILVAFHNRGEYLHTLSAGLLAFDQDGALLAANQAARTLLSGLPAQPGRSFNELFRAKFGAFLDEGQRQPRLRLQDEVGSLFVATIEIPRQFPMLRPPARAQTPPAPPRAAAPSFVCEDPALAAMVSRVEMAASRKMPILIRGETGTGKEQMARHAHEASGRKGAFIAVNCAALPESLIEAELFGYSEGAFTGARKGGSLGLFREADGGTLFLDEIGDMPVSLQTVLLRFLDDWVVQPVGGAKREVDVLLVSATNSNLDELIARGRFRSDLFFRLNTLEIVLPRLKDRRDFAAIVRHLMAIVAPGAELEPEALARLARMDWAGNIRQLRNTLFRLNLEPHQGVIDGAALDLLLGGEGATGSEHARNIPADQLTGDGLRSHLHDLQLQSVRAAFIETGNNVSKTARKLGVSRNTIYRALREHGGVAGLQNPGGRH